MMQEHTVTKSKNESSDLSNRKYDYKLFKQAYKAAKQAKEQEEKTKKKKAILKVFTILLSPVVLLSLVLLILSFLKKPQEYIEAGYTPNHAYFSAFPEQEIYGKSFLEISTSQIQAQSALVFNPRNGDIFFEKNAYEEIPVASLTKILSVIVVLENFKLDDTIQVSLENIPEDVNWSLGLKEGDKITVLNLLKAMLLPSYNDAAYVVANAYPNGGYNSFVEEMNRKAKVLGMENSNFVNPSGWDQEGAYSTAFDVAILVSAARNYKTIVDYVSSSGDTVNWSSNGDLESEKIFTTNQLYGTTQNIKGFKTGITDLAGPCFVGYYVYPNGEELITVVLNSKERFKDTSLLEREYRLKR